MKLERMTIRYDEKRTGSYQAANVGLEITVLMEEGDKKEIVFAAAMKHLKQMVGSEADSAIRELIYAANGG